MPTATNVVYQFDRYQLDPVKRWLTRDGVVVDLPPRTLAVLTVLVSNAGHVVEPKELMARAWPGEPADEARLDKQLAALRATLRDTDSRFLVNIPGKGIRFVQPTDELVVDRAPETASQARVTEPEVEQKQPQTSRKPLIAGIAVVALLAICFGAWKFLAPKEAGKSTPSESADSSAADTSVADSSGSDAPGDSPIAVLPIRSFGGGASDQLANNQLTEAVIAKLGKVSGISVLSMNAVAKYSIGSLNPVAAANQLQAGSVVTVFIQKLGARGRVTIQLVNAGTRKEAWSEAFDTDFNGLADRISKEIAKHVAQAP
jgi:DNA-binding winged helix-turn-helix (wHTH) protein/TolB-like protein